MYLGDRGPNLPLQDDHDRRPDERDTRRRNHPGFRRGPQGPDDPASHEAPNETEEDVPP
jgi:hypothetical protein